MKLHFTGTATEKLMMVNTAVFQTESGEEVTIDRDKTVSCFQDDNSFDMVWKNCYISTDDGASHDIKEEDIAKLKFVRLEIEDDAALHHPDYDIAVTGVYTDRYTIFEDETAQPKEKELVVWFESGYIYFKTKQPTAKKAAMEFDDVCQKAGINIDNLPYSEAVLRNPEGAEIDVIAF